MQRSRLTAREQLVRTDYPDSETGTIARIAAIQVMHQIERREELKDETAQA